MNKMTFVVRDWSIGLKLSLSTFALVGSVFLAFILVIGYSGSRLAEEQAVREVTDKTRMLADTVAIVDKDLRNQVATFAKVFRNNFQGNFAVDTGKTIDVAGKATPVLKYGDNEVNLNFDIPDRFTALTGVYATVFVRSGDDFIRITTSHKKENGERAIGTVLDRAHPGYQAIMNGTTYAGTATLWGGQYMTQYDPIKDAEGKVVGILYVGVNFTDSMKSLADGIKSMKLGSTGIFYALNAKEGKDYGKLLIHPTAEGESKLDAKDDSGREYIKAMLEQKQGSFHYVEADQDHNLRERLVAFSYIKNWNMVIAGDVYLDEITATAVHQRNEYALIGFLMVAMIAGLLYPLIRKMVSRPLSQALKVAETVASGDLTSRIEVGSRDETGRLMEAMRYMNESLAKIVGEVRGGTSTIAAASSQISAGNMDLSSRTEKQASSLENTASSMEELTSTVRQNAANAGQAHQLAKSASDVAVKGGTVVAQVVDTMSSINTSAQKVTDIISVIDGIAFQTNILALNAAVEAARAGEQGRGFAVVAAEVRNLAQRSAAAAKEIKVLIGDSVEQVQAGTKLVDQAGETMHEIVDSIKRVTDIMDEISTASREQTIGIDRINLAINEMDEVTQQNASLVEEAAAAAQSMHDQAGKLAQLVGIFRLNQEDAIAAVPTTEAAAIPTARVVPLAAAKRLAARPVAVPKRVPALARSANGAEWEEF